MTGSFADGRHGASVRRAFAVFAVTLMVVAPALMVLSSLPSVDGAGYTHTVVYHKGDGTDLEVEYYGVPVAEYNPQFWQGNITGTVKSGNPENWNPVSDFSVGQTVFNGWSTSSQSTEGEIDPGDRLDSIEKGEDGKIHLYAVWGKVTDFKEVSTFTGNNDSLDKVYFNTGTKYTNIVILDGNPSLQGKTGDFSIGKDGSTGFTIRSGSDGPYYLDPSRMDIDVKTHLVTDVIIDNIIFWTDNGNTSGENFTARGLYANGHQLIIGTGVTCVGDVTIYGGTSNIDISGDTDIRIFSGTYASVYGGCHNGDIYGSTNVTIMGQNSGTGESATSTTKIKNTLYGGSLVGEATATNILVAGGVMNGSGNHDSGYPVGDSHSNIIGGSRSVGTVDVSNVTVTNNAIVFAVQGGGREKGAITTDAYVTISGKANVIFMVCGSVTNGIDEPENQFPVGTSYVTIKDDAVIGTEGGSTDYGAGSVFGGGWDTYRNALYSSTRHTNVSVEGGTIHGSVYGGGYRGSIGENGVDGSTSVTISGGTVEGNVFGGGRGGIDPMSQSWANTKGSTGIGNTTGRAYIYGDASVTVIGGTVEGNVYGGGEGVAKSYNDNNGVDDVSKVTGSATVKVGSSAKIMGDVYGGGLGVNGSNDVAKILGDTTVIVEGEVGADSNGGSVFGGGQYGNVAGKATVTVSGSVNGSVFGGGQGTALNSYQGAISNTNVTVTGNVTGNVYGGGNLGSVTGDVSVIINGNVTGSVYGGGNGAASNINLGKVGGGVSVTVTGTAGDVFGGGNLGSVSGGVTIEMNAASVKNVYGGGSGQGAISAKTAEVASDIEIILRSTSVSGDLYGGGMGVSSASGPDSVATVKGSISISLLNGSEVSGDLYGGGRYGAVINEDSPGELYINISSSTVHGSVYAGGLGETDRTATFLTNRVAVVTNGSVGGSIYGGSRYGDDNVKTETIGNVSEKQKIGTGTYHSRIYIVSGSISSGTSGNVYGGGFRGYSAMDTYIYIGAPAAAMVPGASAGGSVSVKSVYGGPASV